MSITIASQVCTIPGLSNLALNKKDRIVAYRKGDLDAFLAAFVYWAVAGRDEHSLTLKPIQYMAIDPLDVDTHNRLTKATQYLDRNIFALGNMDQLISIGANFFVPMPGSKLFSYENTVRVPEYPLDPDMGTVSYPELGLNYRTDTTKSLFQAVCDDLSSVGLLDVNGTTFKMIQQFLQLETHMGYCKPNQKVAEEIAIIMPDLSPSDFPKLARMLGSPLNPMRSTKNKKEARRAEELMQYQRQQFANAKVGATTLNLSQNEQLLVVNTDLSLHPLAAEFLRDEELPVFAYQLNNDHARGRLFSPKQGTFRGWSLPVGRHYGNQSWMDVIMPKMEFGVLLSMT